MTSNSTEPSHSEPSLNGTAAGKPTRSIVESLQWIIRVGLRNWKPGIVCCRTQCSPQVWQGSGRRRQSMRLGPLSQEMNFYEQVHRNRKIKPLGPAWILPDIYIGSYQESLNNLAGRLLVAGWKGSNFLMFFSSGQSPALIDVPANTTRTREKLKAWSARALWCSRGGRAHLWARGRVGVAGICDLDTPAILLLLAFWASATVPATIWHTLAMAAGVRWAGVFLWHLFFFLVVFLVITVVIFLLILFLLLPVVFLLRLILIFFPLLLVWHTGASLPAISVPTPCNTFPCFQVGVLRTGLIETRWQVWYMPQDIGEGHGRSSNHPQAVPQWDRNSKPGKSRYYWKITPSTDKWGTWNILFLTTTGSFITTIRSQAKKFKNLCL